ncbi:hypothetical protein J6497_14025 [Bradyrhizobium sp. CNPSo 4026]|nr:hypothetical protein [Bradyrhizobium cenepequi]
MSGLAPPVVGGLRRQARRGRSRESEGFDEPDDDTLRVLVVARYEEHAGCVAPSGLERSWSFTKRGKATSVTVDGRLVVTFNEVGLAAAVTGLRLVSMTVGAARKEISQGLLVRVLADWDMGEVELHAVFPARKSCEAIRACIRRLACFKYRHDPSFWVAVARRVPWGPAGMALIDPRMPP